MFDNTITIRRIAKINSVDFVRQAFDCYRSRTLFMIDSDGEASNADLMTNPLESFTPEAGGGWFSESLAPIEDDAPAQIIFSSGTEGRAKAFVISHRSLANVVTRINKAMQVDSSIREYIGAPATFSFGLARCRAIAAVGGAGFIPNEGFNVREIKTMLDDGEINAISAVPSLWRVLLANADLFDHAGKRVKWIEIGSQYMSADEKRQMKAVFPNAKIVQHYGLTEASRSTLLDISASDETHLESVGSVTRDNIDIALDADSRIMVRGEHVALGRILDGALVPIADDDGWLTTNDLGTIEAGHLYYRGRFDDVVNCGGIKVDPETLQQRVNNRLGGAATVAIAGVPDEMRGEGFLAATTDSDVDHDLIQRAVNDELVTIGVHANDAIHVQQVDAIPRTATGKIRRKPLAELFEPPKRTKPTLDGDASLLAAYREVFADPNIQPKDSFESLGGDSLNFVQLSMSVEKTLGHLPDDWEHQPIEALERSTAPAPSRWAKLEMSVLLRSAAILCIVLSHSGWQVVGGGTYLLFLLIGANFARFQFREFSEGKIWTMLPWYSAKILVPYFFGAVIYSLMTDYFNPLVFLLIQNFYGVGWTIIFPFWFVQVLLQCLLLLGIILMIEPLLRQLQQKPWLASFMMLLAFFAIRFTYPLVWDTAPMSDMVAPRFIAYIWLGWTLYLSDTPLRKLLVAAFGVAFAFADNIYMNFAIWLSLGCVLLPAIRHVVVPRAVKWAASYVAAATFYIFIFNGVTIYFVKNVLGIDAVLVSAIAALVVSFALWAVFDRIAVLARLTGFIRQHPITQRVLGRLTS
ncbi:MAG: AMP-binding protein [Pseudomonadota bacterium]